MGQSFYPFFENWPKGTMKQVLKFNLPWVARIPKGYKMLQMHPMYQDENRFTTLSGILEPHLGHAAVGTIPFYCHFTGVETIKAGTPLAQFVLIPDNMNFEVKSLDDDKIKELSEYAKRKEEIFIDLKEEKVIFGNNELKFKVDSFKKKCLLEGLDDIALSLKKSDKIEIFEKDLKVKKPWVFND